MTQDRRVPNLGYRARQQQVDDRYQVPRTDCPSFDGTNTVEWLRRSQSYFEMHRVPDHMRTHLAMIQFQHRASEWYDEFLVDHDPPPWPDLVRLIRKRFNRIGTKNGMEELLDLHHTGNTEDYIERFERLRSRLLLKNHLFSEADFLDVFGGGGLKPELKAFVKVFKPQSLDDAFDFALHMESALDSQLKQLKLPPRGTTSAMMPKPALHQNSKNNLLDQRQLLGLCFKCGEKYFPGHHCKVNV
jgi:Ty3 transposon capsid-like protein